MLDELDALAERLGCRDPWQQAVLLANPIYVNLLPFRRHAD
jgi:hypothetical protein